MKQILLPLKKLFKGDKKRGVFVVLGLIGICLIFFSSFDSNNSSNTSAKQPQNNDGYSDELEEKIKNLVTAITGDKNCVVAVTLENTGEYVYANQNTVDTNQTEDKANDTLTTKESHKTEQEYIIVKGKDGGQNALIVTEKKPGVRGVAIVASGINNTNYDLILNSVSAMLGIQSRKISIAEAN